MKTRIFSHITLSRVAGTALLAMAMTACNDDIDNYYSRNNSVIQMTVSSEYVVLDEENPDAVALTVEWNEAHPYGNEYITTYQYQVDAVGSKAAAMKEYEDDGVYRREYTHRQLQEMLTGHFGCLTSSLNTLNLTVTASFEGPRIVIPDIATLSVKVKTYGEKQFLADRLFIGGPAAGDKEIEIEPTSPASGIYVWNGALQAGKLNFPVIYGDEKNAIGPETADAPLSDEEMPAVITDAAAAHHWVIPAAGNYRLTVNLNTRMVKIIDAGSIIEIDRLLMSGSAVGTDPIEIERALEAEGLYAWKGELKAGKLYMPIEFDGASAMSMVPKESGNHDIHDGQDHEFAQVSTESGVANAYWEIPADGVYRVIVNTENRTVRIHSAATDMKNAVVSYNNTVDKINPYTQEVTELWMWGGFNGSAHDSDLKAGFQKKYTLKQSLANPMVFVYQGEALPRSTSTDDWSKATGTGALNFLVSNIENNVYAFGSTADAKRNSKRGYLSVNIGETLDLVAGQSDNRYAYFCVPENCNYVVVDIENLKVTFDRK